jgi:hypothetical protein
MLRLGVDYNYFDSDDKNITGIHIIKGKFKDVLYHYHKVRVVEEGEIARLQFGYTIVDSGSHDPDELTNDEEFSTIMGDILTTILQAKIKDEEIRSHNT